MKRVLRKVLVALTATGLIWWVLSFIEIISKNNYPNPQYNPVNLFLLFAKCIECIG